VRHTADGTLHDPNQVEAHHPHHWQEVRMTRDRDYLSDPNQWPHWPLVPMKTINTQNRYIGVIVDESRDEGWRVLDTNIFSFDINAPFTRFDTLDKLLVVWTVD
jgi:hypothetical protein